MYDLLSLIVLLVVYTQTARHTEPASKSPVDCTVFARPLICFIFRFHTVNGCLHLPFLNVVDVSDLEMGEILSKL